MIEFAYRNLANFYKPSFPTEEKPPITPLAQLKTHFLRLADTKKTTLPDNINQRLIFPRCIEIDSRYLVDLPPLYMVAMLDLQGDKKSRAQPHVWNQ